MAKKEESTLVLAIPGLRTEPQNDLSEKREALVTSRQQ